MEIKTGDEVHTATNTPTGHTTHAPKVGHWVCSLTRHLRFVFNKTLPLLLHTSCVALCILHTVPSLKVYRVSPVCVNMSDESHLLLCKGDSWSSQLLITSRTGFSGVYPEMCERTHTHTHRSIIIIECYNMLYKITWLLIMPPYILCVPC